MSPQIVPQSEGEPMGVNHGLRWHGVEVGVNPPRKNCSNEENKLKHFMLASSQIVSTKWGWNMGKNTEGRGRGRGNTPQT